MSVNFPFINPCLFQRVAVGTMGALIYIATHEAYKMYLYRKWYESLCPQPEEETTVEEPYYPPSIAYPTIPDFPPITTKPPHPGETTAEPRPTTTGHTPEWTQPSSLTIAHGLP